MGDLLEAGGMWIEISKTKSSICNMICMTYFANFAYCNMQNPEKLFFYQAAIDEKSI
jgi:hypothetical protein